MRYGFDALILKAKPAALGDVLRQRFALDHVFGVRGECFGQAVANDDGYELRQGLGRRRVPGRPIARLPKANQ